MKLRTTFGKKLRPCSILSTIMFQVDFASTLLSTPAEFVSIWSEVETLNSGEVLEALPVFVTMGSILAAAIVCMGLGWHKDRKVSEYFRAPPNLCWRLEIHEDVTYYSSM